MWHIERWDGTRWVATGDGFWSKRDALDAKKRLKSPRDAHPPLLRICRLRPKKGG